MQQIYEKLIEWTSFKRFIIVFLAQVLLLAVIVFYAMPAFRPLTAGYDPFIAQNKINTNEIYKQLPYYGYKSVQLADLIITLDFIHCLFHVFATLLLWSWLIKLNRLPFYDMLVKNHLFGLGALGAVFAFSESSGFLFLIHAYPFEFFDMARHACFLKKAKMFMTSWGYNSMTAMFIFCNIATRIMKRRRNYW